MMSLEQVTGRVINARTRMDHDWYPFSTLPSRPPLRWPGGARVAVWVVPALEVFDLLPPDDPGQYPPAPVALDVKTWAQREYGNRWGVWRVMEVLDEFGIRGSAPVNSALIERYPEVLDAALERNWEILGHGVVSSSMITTKLSPEAELELIVESRDALARRTGVAPAGWLSPQVSESLITPRLLGEAGFTYTADWASDEQPWEMQVGDGRTMIAVPYSRDLDDTIVMPPEPAWVWSEFVRDTFDGLYRMADTTGFVLCLPLHPYCIGQPLRIKYLHEVLAHIAGHSDVWFATGSEIAEHFRTTTADT